MSPEKCRGEDNGPASDQYSLGVVLCQVCTGRLPYEADTPMGVVIQQASQPLPPPRLANPNLTYAAEEVLVKVLDKDPGGRYESVAALDQAFQGAVKASLHPTGTYRRRQLRAEHPSEKLSRAIVLRGLAREGTRRVRRLAPLLAALFLLGCPAAAWAFGILPPFSVGSSTAMAES
jgi:serine/threonine protein kinase